MGHKIYQINHCTEDNIVGFVDINKYQLRRELLGREYYSPFEHPWLGEIERKLIIINLR